MGLFDDIELEEDGVSSATLPEPPGKKGELFGDIDIGDIDLETDVSDTVPSESPQKGNLFKDIDIGDIDLETDVSDAVPSEPPQKGNLFKDIDIEEPSDTKESTVEKEEEEKKKRNIPLLEEAVESGSRQPGIDIVTSVSPFRRIGEQIRKLPSREEGYQAIILRKIWGLDIPPELGQMVEDPKETSPLDMITWKGELGKAVEEKLGAPTSVEDVGEIGKQPGAVIAAEMFREPIKEIADLTGLLTRPSQISLMPLFNLVIKGLGWPIKKLIGVIRRSGLKKGDTTTQVVGKIKNKVAEETGVPPENIDNGLIKAGELERNKLETELKGDIRVKVEGEQESSGIEALEGGGTETTKDIPPYKFPDPEIEARFEAAKGIGEETTLGKIKGAFNALWHKITRDFEHLPTDPVGLKEFAKLKFDLLKLKKAYGITSDKTVRNINDIISVDGVLTSLERDLFRRKVILNDLVTVEEAGKSLPFGFTKESLTDAVNTLDARITGSPKVSAAIARRTEIWNKLRSDYTDAMKSINFNVELPNEEYFRHQVLQYAQLKHLYGTGVAGKRLKTPSGRGFLKTRKGSELDINTDYIQAETEVMAQMLYDIEVAKTIRAIDDGYNIASVLKARAKKNNYREVVGGQDNVDRINYLRGKKAQLQSLKEGDSDIKRQIAEITEEIGLLDLTLPFRKKLAIGISMLKQMAKKGELPKEFEGIATSLEEGTFELSDKAFKVLGKMAEKDIIPAKTIFKAIAEREEFIKKTLGEKYLEWKLFVDPRLIPDKYTVWQPREGHAFYMSDSIPANLAQRLENDTLKELLITKEDLRKVMARGRKFKELIIKDEVATTLDNLTGHQSSNVFSRVDKTVLRAWKQWTLISPRRWFKYNFRNTTGDADAVFVGNPSGFKKLPRAFREIYNAAIGKPMTPELKAWYERGGVQSTLQAQEMGELNRLETFTKALKKKNVAGTVLTKSWSTYWKAARISTDMREMLLRYANFLDYLEYYRIHGVPRNYGASIPEEIMGLASFEDKSFWLANDLLGAYDRVSVLGNNLRDHFFPFWSWKELNFKRYVRFARNAVRDKESMSKIGRKLGAKTPYTAYRVGAFVTKATAFWSMLQTWNITMFPELEKQLPEEERSRPHLIFGQDKDGKTVNFTRLGAVGDFLQWFGLDAAPQHLSNWFEGKRTIKEIAKEMIKSPVNVVIQGSTPTVKLPMELTTRRSTFPNVFKPTTIRNRGLHLARSLGLADEYKLITNLPSEPYGKSLPKLFVYKSDPLQSAYHDTFAEKNRFLVKLGKSREGFMLSPKGNALYDFKLALRYEDAKAAEKALMEYLVLGGSKEGLKKSLENLHPFHPLTTNERKAFILSLTEEGRDKLQKAIDFYEQVLRK